MALTKPLAQSSTFQQAQLNDAVSLTALVTALAASTGAAQVGFKQAFTGASARTLQDKNREIVSPEDFLAVGDNVTDDTAAINAALASGAAEIRLSQGKTYYCATTVNVVFNGQRISGKGAIRSGATVGILVTNLDDVEINGIEVQASGTATASEAIRLNSCTNSRVERCKISNHRLYGVRINGTSSGCAARHNRFFNAAITPSYGLAGGCDIGIEENANYCQASQNICRSGNGSGVQIRNFKNNIQHCDYHSVSGNTIIGYNDYGIVLYRDGPYAPDVEANLSVYGCSIVGNVIKDISGIRPNAIGGTDYIFGSGIYIQGAEHSTVSGNTITNTHSANQVVELVSPGSIGCSNVGDISITGNSCRGDAMAGIYINDQVLLGGTTGGGVVVTGNTIVNTVKRGIYVNSRSNVIISANHVDTTIVGIQFDRGSSPTNTMSGVLISNNRLNNVSSNGISINYVTGLHITDNQIKMTAGDAINIANGTDVHIAGNRLNGYVRGVVLAATVTGVVKCIDNQVVGDGTTSTIGLLLNCPTYQGRNVLSGHITADANGTYADGRTLVDSTTPDVTGNSYVLITPAAATTITNFTGIPATNQITIRATNGNATLASNTTLLLAGSANFAMASGSSITLQRISSTQWLEIGRKA